MDSITSIIVEDSYLDACDANCGNAGTIWIAASSSSSTIDAIGANCSNAGAYWVFANNGAVIGVVNAMLLLFLVH